MRPTKFVSRGDLASHAGRGLFLACLPPAGGSSSTFRKMKELASADLHLAALELPGRGRLFGMKPPPDLATLAEEIAEELDETLSGEDMALLGHSMGASIAFATAHALRARNRSVRALILSAPRPLMAVKYSPEQLSDHELTARLKHWGGTPQVVLQDQALMTHMLRVLRADLMLLDDWAPPDRPLENVPTLFLHGSGDVFSPSRHASAWMERIASRTECAEIAGGHFFINERPTEVLGHVRRFTREA